MLESKRMFFRPWTLLDAGELYRYARDPLVGPIAGWPPHTDIEHSRQVIQTVLSAPETYAVILKESGLPIGSIGLLFGQNANAPLRENEAEIGFWLGVPYWEQGLMTEAVRALLQYCFETLRLDGLWCGWYDGNRRSKRLQEKCGFVYSHTEYDKPCVLMGDRRTEHYSYLSAAQYFKENV